MKTFKSINDYADNLVNKFGRSLIENNLEIKLPEKFSNLSYEEKIEYLLKNHSKDLEEDMGHYNANAE